MTQPRAAHEHTHGDFESLYSTKEEPWRYSRRAIEVLRHEYVADLARTFAPTRILELGCGLGHLTRRLQPLPAWLCALDVAPTAAARARERLGSHGAAPEFLVGSATSLPVGAARFDLIIAADGPISWDLDARQRAAALAEMHRVLAPGGRVIITEFMRPARFPEFIGEVVASPLQLESTRYLHDRLWYQFETWFAAVPDSRAARLLLGSLPLARALRRVGRLRGASGSRHICIVAARGG